MAKKYYTSDWHLGSEIVATTRGFKTADNMNTKIVAMSNAIANSDDIIISAGDVCQYGKDRNTSGLAINPNIFIKTHIMATFINIEGNHDNNNKIKSIGNVLWTSLGKKYQGVVVCHYPSWDSRCTKKISPGTIILHGHTHSTEKYCVDLDTKNLNINIGLDAWNYRLVSEEKLIEFIDSLVRLPLEKIRRLKKDSSGKIKLLD